MTSLRRTPALALLAVALAALAAGGQEPGAEPRSDADDPVLEALVADALRANPDLLALQQRLVAARARPDQARALADPMLSVVYTNDGWAPSLGREIMSTLAFMGSQALPWPGKRELRADLAARDADLVEQQLERARLSVVADVTRAYYGLVLSRELVELVREQERLWRQIEGVARARYAVGQGAQPDVLRVQVEVTRVEQRVVEQQAEARIRAAELNRLAGQPAARAIETAARLSLRPAGEGLDTVVERLSLRSPELAAAAAAEERARVRVALADKEYKPDFAIQAGYMNRGGLDPMWQAGVSLSLPLQRKRLASGLAEAEAAARASALLEESVRLQLRYRCEERLAQLAATERIATLYANGIIPQDRMSVDAALANYQSGKVPFIAVLEALTTLYGDRATHLELLANHERIKASLEEASLEATSSLAPGTGMRAGAAAGMAAPVDAASESGRSMP